MHRPLLVRRGLNILFALALAGSSLPLHAAPPSTPEPPRPRKADPAELPLHTDIESPADPAQTPALAGPESLPWSKLTFQSIRNFNDWEIYSSLDDGTNQSQLTQQGAEDIHPRFNRGATRLAFASSRTGNYEIFSMNPDGSGLTQITNNATDDVNPAWSPDGTKIAFQAYRDGQAEIYLMNADGSGQTRLTVNADYDGGPAWSPDGSQLAFSSYRNGGYRIWVMAANGSGQTQRSTQPYSFDPAWSPDGSQIAFDADSDGDGWQDLWRMNANGSNPQLVYDPAGTTDAWPRSWSPDGRYVAFTQIDFINYGGTWYWTGARLTGWDTTGLTYIINLSAPGQSTDWNPDWQTTDAASPTASVNALPAQSPGPIPVSWHGSDIGAAGLRNFDVQVKDGAGGAWMDWLVGTAATTAFYPGLGGHTYYFRARARDNAYNLEAWPATHDAVTAVEALPPQSAVLPLPAFARENQSRLLQWGGGDPGNSGIQVYQLQYRDVTNNGDWTDYYFGSYTTTNQTSTPLFSCGGQVCAYRARARDNAQNQEDWPAEADTQTTFYRWGITGVVHDNAGALVSSAAVTLTPHSYSGTLTSDGAGYYSAYALNFAGQPYLAQWGKPGYGPLPGTTFAENSEDVALDLYLPPADNVLVNGEFESGDLSDWLAQGLISPVVTNTLRHTGDYAALVGTDQLFTEPQNVSGGKTGPVLMAQDSGGAIHLAWADPIAITYTRRDNTGAWSSPQTVATMATWHQSSFDLIVTPDGNPHIVWDGWENGSLHVYYARRDSNGTWSTAEKISQTAGGWGPQAAADSTGNVQVIWMTSSPDSGSVDIYSARRDISNGWAAPLAIANTAGSSSMPHLAIDNANTAHVIWEEDLSPTRGILYARRPAGGPWSVPQTISGSTYAFQPALAVEAGGIVHVVWFHLISSLNVPVYYARRAANGVWSAPTSFAVASQEAVGVLQLHVKADAAGTAHAIWHNGDNDDKRIFYAQRPAATGVWSSPVTLSDDWLNRMPQLVVNANGLVHVTWNNYGRLVYTKRDLNGVWSAPREITPHAPSVDEAQRMVADEATGSFHLAWSRGNWETGIYYEGPNPVAQTHVSALQQVVSVPITHSTPTLSFLYQLGNFSGLSAFHVRVLDASGSTALFSTTARAEDWTHGSFDLSAWAGQTITLTFDVEEVAGQLPAWIYLDEISLGSSYPDLWVQAIGANAGRPGQTVTYQIIYGNAGGAAAADVTLTNTLPAELMFVDASLPPASTAPTLTWEVGQLPAHSGPFTITITATVAPAAPLLSMLTTLFETRTLSLEFETANNTYQLPTLIGALTYLPIVRR